MTYRILRKEQVCIANSSIIIKPQSKSCYPLVFCIQLGLILTIPILAFKIASPVIWIALILGISGLITLKIITTNSFAITLNYDNLKVVRFRYFLHLPFLTHLMRIHCVIVEFENNDGIIKRVRLVLNESTLSSMKVMLVKKDVRVE